MAKREIPKKNYLLFLLLCILIVVLTFAIVNIGMAIKNKKVNSGYLNKYVSQLQYSELENYLIELANDTFIYLTYVGDEKVYNVETKLKKIIINNDLQDNFVYINVTEEMGEANFIDNLNKILNCEKRVESVPAILYFKDGSLVGTLEEFEEDDFQKLLDQYEIAI